MRIARLTAFASLVAAAAAFRAHADEVNYWPFYVMREDPAGHTESWSSLGPLFFSGPGPGPDATHADGFRPLYVQFVEWDKVTTDILYPIFFYRKYSDSYKWSFLQLINHYGMTDASTQAGGPKDKHFEIWPFYFSHEADNPADTYHALFPVYGAMKGKLGYAQLNWILFPVFVESLKRGTHTTYVPWPILRVMTGASHGFAVWPLFYMTKGPGPARTDYFLWPLIWNNTLELPVDAPPGTAPETEFGFLPFYTRETGPGYVNENFVWPFFGYTERETPYRYSERRYFWPFFVQGKGDTPGQERVIDRWAPLYTYSLEKGVNSTWIGWPFWHRKTWDDGDIHQSKTQFFYFLYSAVDQTSVSRPSLAPAYKRHIWPLISIWDNGAGHRQFEIPSLTEVFFSNNTDVRASWSPLFTLFRQDREPTGETRSSLLWDAVTWRRSATEGLVEFHLGPILGMRRRAEGKRWSILGFDFGGKMNKDTAASR